MSRGLDKKPIARYLKGMITPQQIRGARAMLGLTQAALARLADISTTGLNNIERGAADPKVSTLAAIQAALESAGVEFTNGDRPGVRLSKGTLMFELIGISEVQITVRHKVAGHEYTYLLPEDKTVPITNAPSVRLNDTAERDHIELAPEAFAFARAEARKKGWTG